MKKKKSELEVVVNLHSESFVKQLKKVQKEFEKLGDTELTFSIEQEDEPVWHIIKRRIQKFLSKLTTK